MLRLVVCVICLALQTSGAVDRTEATDKPYVGKSENSPLFNSKAGVLSDLQFHCHKRPSGYYADPRFKCEVFHYCHTDGTRVTIPCSKDSQKHRICFLKDIASKACDGSELFLPLPEDLFFKSSKDTTASAFNGATEFKLPEVLPEPNFSSESNPSTTPLSSENENMDRTRSSLKGGDVSSIYEVFNSFLKEIEAGQDAIRVNSSSSLPPRPSTFSRRSRLPSSLEQRDALVDVSPRLDRRIDEDGTYLVEVYNSDDEILKDNDYSPYRRKSKKLFFTSDKKTPAKHPRKKRTVPQQQTPHRPYAIIYAKVPDTTRPSSFSGLSHVPSAPQDKIELPFVPAMVPGDVPVVPITIETRRKKKTKSKKKTLDTNREVNQMGQQQTAEQQNVYFYSPEQISNVQQRSPDGRTVVDPRRQVRGNAEQLQNQQPQNGRPQPGRQSALQSNGAAPYTPQNLNRLQLPNFPFQTQPFLSGPSQSPYFFGAQEGYQPFSSPFRPLDQFQGRPQLLGAQTPQSQQGHIPSVQGQIPSVHRQPSRSRQPSERPSGSQISEGPTNERVREEIPTNAAPQQGYPGFQSPFYDSFPAFGSAAFNSPFNQRDPTSFSLVPPTQLHQQSPALPSPQQPPQGYSEQGRPQYSVQEIPQTPQGHVRSETFRPGISAPIRPAQEFSVYGQDRTRQPNANIQVLPDTVPQRPPRGDARPTSPNSPSHFPEGNRENHQQQQPRRPPSNAIQGERGRQQPEQYPPYEAALYQPGYSPELRPERPSSNRIPNEQGQALSRPTTVLVEDYRQRRPRPQTVENNSRDTSHAQRQPSSERNRDERQRHPERDRGSQRQPPQTSQYYSPTAPPPSSVSGDRQRYPEHDRGSQRQPPQSSHYYSPTTPPPSSRTRQTTRTRERTRQPTRSERHRQRSRPVEESDVRNVIEKRPDFGHRTPPSSQGNQLNERVRPVTPENIPVSDGYYQRPSPPNPSNEIPDPYNSPTTRPLRHREIQSQPQIEQPPPDYNPAQPLPNAYSDPQGYYPYPPKENDVNVISTVEDSESRPRTPPSTTVRRPSHRGSGSRREPEDHRNTDAERGFRPMTVKPYMESYYRTRTPVNENIEVIEEYRAPEKVRDNRYKDLDEIPPTTSQISTTRRPTTKRRPPPPKPTFPTFPTFPPPPRRPITTPRPRSESAELKKEVPDTYTNEPEYIPTSENRAQLETLADTENLRSKEHVTEDYSQTNNPEVTTRRRTRKRKPRPRRPRPTASYNGEDQTSGDIITQPTTEKEITTRSSSGRHNGRWRQQTNPQPYRPTTTPATEVASTGTSAKSEEFGSRINLFGRQRPRKKAAFQPRTSSTTQAAPLLREESMRVSKVPGAPRNRKSYAKRLRARTSTMTPENSKTDEPVNRSDENVEFLNYQSTDMTPIVTSSLEYEHSTFWPMESTTEVMTTTEPYNQMVETTTDVTTLDFDEGTELPQTSHEKMDDFESTRSVLKKFQNRPRVLKFGKPKLKSTISPIDLNVAESRIL